MAVEADFIQHLLADAGVSAIAATGVWPVVRPQRSALPGATVTRISGVEGRVFEGGDGLVSSVFQVDCWGLTYAAAKALAEAVKAAAASFSAKGVFTEGERDSAERTDAATIFRTSIDLRVWHQA